MAAANSNGFGRRSARTPSARVPRTNAAEGALPKHHSKLQSTQLPPAVANTAATTKAAKSKMAARQKNRNTTAAASSPLELLVVGRQLQIHPLPLRCNPTAQLQHCGEAANKMSFMQDGDFVYIYESSWPSQLLTLAQQVVDSRFLAEFMDELLIRDP